MQDDLARGIIKPINTTIFDAEKVEEAFRYMTNGKHIGKILLRVRENENATVLPSIAVSDRVYFGVNESVVIVGGLGGFGLEMAEWIVSRNCLNILLCSRTGLKNAYQKEKVMYVF